MSAGTNQRSAFGRLAVMMFLQYAVWGAWLPVAGRYISAPVGEGGLGFTAGQLSMILGAAGSIGAISAPFIAGQLADRWFSSERFLAFLLVIGGVVNWMLSTQTSYESWLWLTIAYGIVFMPTLALSNSIAFANLPDRENDFPRVRVWGTVGWIAASWAFPMIWLQSDLLLGWMPPFLTGPEVSGVTSRLSDALVFSAVISFGYAAYCLFLPHTPPQRGGVEPLAFKSAFALFTKPSFAVLVLVSLAISAIHNIYFIQAGPFLSSIGLLDSQIGPALTIGQFSEILFMAMLGWFLHRFGFNRVITIGALAYFARYMIWSMTDLPVPLLIGSLVLHGICYACFFASAFIFVDRLAPADIRNSAQTVFGIIILGGGPVLGGQLSGFLGERYTTLGVLDFSPLWSFLAWIGLIAAGVFQIFFRDPTREDAAA